MELICKQDLHLKVQGEPLLTPRSKSLCVVNFIAGVTPATQEARGSVDTEGLNSRWLCAAISC